LFCESDIGWALCWKKLAQEKREKNSKGYSIHKCNTFLAPFS